MSQFNEFPKVMLHSQHADAVFSKLTPEQQAMKGLFAPIPELLTPERWPNVTVFTKEQEQQYASRGYRPANNANADEYDQAILESKTVDGYENNDYPRWMYHAVEIPVVVKNAQEESALGVGWERSPVIASEDDLIEQSLTTVHTGVERHGLKTDKRSKEYRQHR
jgi:hypothetical protein